MSDDPRVAVARSGQRRAPSPACSKVRVNRGSPRRQRHGYSIKYGHSWLVSLPTANFITRERISVFRARNDKGISRRATVHSRPEGPLGESPNAGADGRGGHPGGRRGLLLPERTGLYEGAAREWRKDWAVANRRLPRRKGKQDGMKDGRTEEGRRRDPGSDPRDTIRARPDSVQPWFSGPKTRGARKVEALP